MKRSTQLPLFTPAKRRRRRKGSAKLGRKPRPDRVGLLPHAARPEHNERHPVHVSMKRVRLAPSFRAERVYRAIVVQIAAAVKRGIKVLHHSVQSDHLHIMVEGADKQALARGMKLLFSRIAFAVNAVARRHGSLFRERHHRHELKTPTEVRRALVYILFNSRKHANAAGDFGPHVSHWLDAKSSAPWFKDWHPDLVPPDALLEMLRTPGLGSPPIHPPTTWLARVGWRRAGGPIRFNEVPHVA